VRRAFESADTLVTEILLTDSASDQGAILARGVKKGLPPILERVGPEHREMLARKAAELGVPMPMLDAVETWVAALTLAAAQLAQLGLDGRDGVEYRLATLAAARGMQEIG